MNVISHAVDDQRCSLNFTDDASEVGKQTSAKIWLDQRPPPLGAEDQMQQNIAGCMRQVFRPCRGFSFVLAHPRLAPWAAFLRRYRGLLIITVSVVPIL
jgi:hypothetical protein